MKPRLIEFEEDEKNYYCRFLVNGGKTIRATVDKVTKEILFSIDDVCQLLGYKSMKDYFSSDAGLDGINRWKEANPGKELFGDCIKK
ncbi:prophage antirepressor-like protein [Parabacteroides sp. PFB2-12]|uniref:hypothetical protein n=1 Tax=unclassified Parabacteroides TaxID=2649774 RepID=UPI0024746994|nr:MULTISPECIES: hypothetical protein [unclassified Parabacteroides]MDH6343159.1 prophage antirepressor-like protein [Parabacteroides sp. PM6-13]MDH6390803.1 prophage antirepressor-like protein [Parabacteroides sp. PFB2-12]